MDSDQKQKEAWQQQLAEDWMIEMNMISAPLLQKIRIVLMVVYPIQNVEVECDPSKFTMKFDCKFKFWGSLFRKKRLTKEIHGRLADRFKNYQITVNAI